MSEKQDLINSVEDVSERGKEKSELDFDEEKES